MKKLQRLAVLLTLAIIMLSAATNARVLAATPRPPASGLGNGYRISPVRTDLTIERGSSKTVIVYITNVTASPENLRVLVNDFQADGESGAPALFLNPSVVPTHGLKQFLTIPAGLTTLQPGERKSITATIVIPANAKAGGYFGAVRFAPNAQGSEKTVSLAASVASIILVSVPGNVKQQVSLASFDVRQNGQQRAIFVSPKKLEATARFQNSGDLQEAPFGKVLLQRGGKTLASYEINNTEPRGNVLPDSIRRLSVPLDKVGSYGKYTVVGNFGYGGSGQLLTAKTTFFVIPIVAIGAVVIVGLLVLFAVFVLPRLIGSYNQSIVRRANRAKR